MESMVWVPPGEFLLGCRFDETATDDDGSDLLASARPQRTVTLGGYWIDRMPVTNREYRAFLRETGYPVPTARSDQPRLAVLNWDRLSVTYPSGTGDHPVVLVSWFDALAYCDWIGKRLPTELEWEKAARGSDGRPFPWGWADPTEARCNIGPIGSEIQPTPVGSCPRGASPYGCLDMFGTVAEWCVDWYEPDRYTRLDETDLSGPPRPVDCPARVVRGMGLWMIVAHVGYRGAYYPWDVSGGIGFRCACS
jgi:serine/threonine-protein kinase